MITLKEACKIVTLNHPYSRIIRCLDYGEFYGFETVARTWAGDFTKLDKIPANNSLNYIRRSNGKESFLSFMDTVTSSFKPKEIDICKYLSREDADFIKRIKHNSFEKERKNNVGL